MLIYFFVNNLGLPHGLLYTAMLTPVFIYWIYKNCELKPLIAWSMLAVLPLTVEWFSGTRNSSFLVSSGLLFTAIVFGFAAKIFIRKINDDLPKLFRTVLIINGLLLIPAIITLFIPSIRELMWFMTPISPGIPAFPRLEMFTYEPSYYSFLMAPVFIYYLLKALNGQIKHWLLVVGVIGFSLLLSLSFGIIGGIGLSFLVTLLLYFHKATAIFKKVLFYQISASLVVLVLLFLVWPDNPVYQRIANIFTGEDTSANGRIFTSFMFAYHLIKENDALVFGIGPGQIKLLAHELIINYYNYTGDYAKVVRIPNSNAEMLATFGFYGIFLKLGLEAYFFKRQKLHKNAFNLTLFTFMFVYQFTGSFLVNVVEIGGWMLAFYARFPSLDWTYLQTQSAQTSTKPQTE